MNGMTTQELAVELGINRSSAHKQAVRFLDQGILEREQLPNGSNIWKLVNQ